jgi:hypothetical protein
MLLSLLSILLLGLTETGRRIAGTSGLTLFLRLTPLPLPAAHERRLLTPQPLARHRMTAERLQPIHQCWLGT